MALARRDEGIYREIVFSRDAGVVSGFCFKGSGLRVVSQLVFLACRKYLGLRFSCHTGVDGGI